MADKTTIPAAAWHDWHGERWAVATCAMFREGMPVVTLPETNNWIEDRRLTEAQLNSAIATPPAPKIDPWVHDGFAPAFAAAARVVATGPLTVIRLYDDRATLCGVVMPMHAREGMPGIVRLSTLCTFEVDRG